jgi:pimeloyl-ACP methyl ester carboxylesterase
MPGVSPSSLARYAILIFFGSRHHTGGVTVVRAGVLDVDYERYGDPRGWPVVLLHGFPYDPRCYDEVAGPLAEAGADVVVPYLRGYGPTRFVDSATPRSGQQAALAHDLRELIDSLGLQRPIVGGYDWGGRAACLVATLWPDSVSGLVTVDGYNVQDIARANIPAAPELESALWYQYYLHGERGVRGLEQNRAELARLLWRQWSPGWAFTDEQFAATAASFDNPDFVPVVVHSYRHRLRRDRGPHRRAAGHHRAHRGARWHAGRHPPTSATG